MSDSSDGTAATTPIAPLEKRPQVRAQEPDPLIRFHTEYPPLAGEFPHHNPRRGATLFTLKVTCDDCTAVLPLGRLHGVINDYAHCTEVRYVGGCHRCHRVVHNVLRIAGDEMRFIRGGKWCVSIKRPWWHCLWPWPLDAEEE